MKCALLTDEANSTEHIKGQRPGTIFTLYRIDLRILERTTCTTATWLGKLRRLSPLFFFFKFLCLVLLQPSLSLDTLLSAQWQSLEDHLCFKLHLVFKVVLQGN